jgi:hypothetical protein
LRIFSTLSTLLDLLHRFMIDDSPYFPAFVAQISHYLCFTFYFYE